MNRSCIQRSKFRCGLMINYRKSRKSGAATALCPAESNYFNRPLESEILQQDRGHITVQHEHYQLCPSRLATLLH